MATREVWRWTFLGYTSADEGKPVQKWFDGLLPDEQDEIADQFRIMATVNSSLWRRPEFDPLDGEDFSEIRPPDIRSNEGSKTYRVYGFFGPGKHEWTMLHGSEKSVKNDRDGKRIARERLAKIQQSRATTHEFNFSGEPSSSPKKEPGSSGKILRFHPK
jgi:thiamine kinase-like enzyme